MTWVRFEDRFPFHRKVRRLSDAAFRLHVSGTCWSVEHLTDGRITTEDLALVSDVRRPERVVSELVARQMWETTEDGWCIHDFLTYQPSAEQVRHDRVKAAERQQRARDAARDRAMAARESREQSRRDDGVTHGSGSIPPTRPDPTRTKEHETSSRGPRKRGTRLPDDWQPTAENVTWARSRGMDDLFQRRHTEKFRNHWLGATGPSAVKLDWSRAWMNWLLTEQERAPRPTGTDSRRDEGMPW